MGERFVVEGKIPAVFPSSRVLELWVFDDGTLSGSVLNAAQNGEANDFKLMHGTAVRQKQDPADDDPQEPVYDVRFQIAKPKFERKGDLRGLVDVISVVGRLSSCSGLHAHWRKWSNTYDFVLSIRQSKSSERRAVTRKPSDLPLLSLAPGAYALKGAAIGANGYMYPATCVLKLRVGGQLEGSYTENERTTLLDGSWSSTGVYFTLHYLAVNYAYGGNMSAAGFRGYWRATSATNDNDGSSGTFDFTIVESCRPWSHSSHKNHPKIFRDVVRLCLLSSLRASETTGESNVVTPRLPSHLWSEVFSYCEYDWFPVSSDSSEARNSAIDTSTFTMAKSSLVQWSVLLCLLVAGLVSTYFM